MRHTRTSTYLIFLATISLLLNFAMIFFVFRTVRFLENDARIINRMGIIRGSIQRITKLELSGQQSSSGSLIQKTDSLIQTFLHDEEISLFAEGHDEFDIEHIRDIEYQWRDLKTHFASYRQNRTPDLLTKIIKKSESCWDSADFAVLNAQAVAENKVSGLQFSYVILSVYAINILMIIWIAYAYVRKSLEFRASHDSLTGLLNRHAYEKSIETELERSTRYKRIFSLILFDVDFFKNVNDTYGHKTGDRVLMALSQIVRNLIRKNDEVFRIGGEEFAIILPETGIDRSATVAEKIRKEVENHLFYENVKVTISLGIAESSAEKTVSDIYRQADEALYKAKNNGRNRVEKHMSGK